MTESSNPIAGDSPAEAKTNASTNVGAETSASFTLARVGSLRVGEPLASTTPEVAAPTSNEAT